MELDELARLYFAPSLSLVPDPHGRPLDILKLKLNK